MVGCNSMLVFRSLYVANWPILHVPTSFSFPKLIGCDYYNPLYNVAMLHPDVIMDMLGSEEERMAILDYYQRSDEPQAVENAIEEVCNTINEDHIQQRLLKITQHHI